MQHNTNSRGICVRFGLAVVRRRRERGLTQEALAFKAEIHRTCVGDIERGARNVSLRNIGRLASALDTDIRDLFSIPYFTWAGGEDTGADEAH